MVKGGKVSSKRKVKGSNWTKCKESDDSADEDYVISDEENEVSEDLEEDYCSSLDGDASEQSSGSFAVEEEEDEEEVKKVRKNSRSRAKKDSDRFIVDEEEENTEEVLQVSRAVRSKAQNGLSVREKNGVQPSRKRRKTRYQQLEDQEYDDEDDDDEDDDDVDEDEEFSPDEDDFSEVEEKPVVKKKKTYVKMGKRPLRKKGSVRVNRITKAMASKNPLERKGRKSRTLRRKVRCNDNLENDGDFMDSDLPVTENNEKKRLGKKRRRKCVVRSDSDFVSSGPSDEDFTISEEEREQVREATEFCESLKTNLLSSSLSTNIQVQQPRKPLRRKGKEKVLQLKVEVAKQICGICLSEEDKRRVRGTLDCCVHYFCFACIMEWGKVESRCPLCKQRFKTITKPAKPATGMFLREVVIQVPERDQVYQPTEEELRSYFDPYEDVLCSVCHEGGEDSLMLLCDMCDSPTHTYCAGLGREVPEGNWYCEGCRPVAMGSSSSQGQGWPSDQRTTNNILSIRQSPVVNQGSGIDLNSVSSPRSHFSQAFVNLPSPRLRVGGFQAASPVSGAGTPTLSGRRRIHRHIQQLFQANRTSYMASRTERNSSDSLNNIYLNYQAALGRQLIVQHTEANEMEVSHHTFFEERLQDNPLAQLQDNNFFSSVSSPQRMEAIQDPTTISADRFPDRTLQPELIGINSISGYGQFPQLSSRPVIGADGGVTPNPAVEQSDFHRAKDQLKAMVESHLNSLSRDMDLDEASFKEIRRKSTHTVLALCELEHRGNEVVAVPLPSSACSHLELAVGGKASLLRGFCSSCFESYVGDVVKRILDTRVPHWLSLGL